MAAPAQYAPSDEEAYWEWVAQRNSTPRPADMLFGDRPTSLKNHVCVGCGNPVTRASFKDELSAREYAITAHCQSCQNEMYR